MMSLKLRKYLSRMRSIQPGETIRVNHFDLCEAGHDSKRRLYLTRTLADPCVIIGFCHNCQQGGKISDNGFTYYRSRTHADSPRTLVTTSPDLLATFNKGVADLDLWPSYAKAWAIKGKLNRDMINDFKISFLVSEDRVCLPMYSHMTLGIGIGDVKCDNLFGLQTRAVNGQAPKYYTTINKDSQGYTHLKRTQTYNDNITIVEDYVSGINIIKSKADTDVIVNYGVKINPHVVQAAANYKKAYIWLDNDAVHIVTQSKIYGRTIALFNDQIVVHRVSEKLDPKKYTSLEIETVIGTR